MKYVPIYNVIIKVGFYLLFILVPLILTPWNYELFEYNKMMITYGLTVIIVGAWVVKSIHEKELKVVRTPLDIPIWLFVGSQCISALFSMDPHGSGFGYYSRFNGGMLSVFSYTLLYYAFVSNMIPHKPQAQEASHKDNAKKMTSQVPGVAVNPLSSYFRVIIAGGAVVCAYGVAEHFGIDKHLWVQDVQSRGFSTLGQPNWLAAYIVAIIPLSLAYALPPLTHAKLDIKKLLSSPQHWFFACMTVLFFITLLFTRSKSGLLGLAVCDIAFWTILFLATKKVSSLRPTIIFFHVIFAIIIFFNGSNIAQVDKYFTFNGISDLITRH